MDQIVILDRQPMLRLGLKLLLAEKYQVSGIQEARNFEEFCANPRSNNEVSIFILGLDPENEELDLRVVRNIKRQFPRARIILYADNIEAMGLMLCFRNGISAYITKQSSETELLECLQTVSNNKRYLSPQFFIKLTRDLGQYPSFFLPQLGLQRRSMKYKTI